MDILRVLSTPDLEVRKKTLQLALDLVSSRNVEEVSGMHSISMFLVVVFMSKHGHSEKNSMYCKYSDINLFSSW